MNYSVSDEYNLSPEFQPDSKEQSSDFWKTIRTNIKLQHQAPPIKPVHRTGDLPLSLSQERLWFLDQLQPESSSHNMRAAFQLKGLLSISVLETSLREIVRRHEILRTTFPAIEGQPVQSISPEIDLKLPVIDLRYLPENVREAEAERLAILEAEQPFDLEQGPLMRVKLLRLADEEYWLLLVVHHMVFDGWSYKIFMRELAVLYDAYSTGNCPPLSDLPIQFADFARSQRQWLQGELLESRFNYWHKQLSGNITALDLPIDRPRPAPPSYKSSTQVLALSQKLTEALKGISHQEGVSMFATLLAAFKILLYQYTGQKDILICSPLAGRNRVGTRKLIGYFNNLVIMRTDLAGNPSFRELVGRVSNSTLGAYEHQDMPFQKLAEFPNLARIPLNRAMFALQNTPSQPQNLGSIAVSSVEPSWATTNFDFFLSMYENERQLAGMLEYKTDLFDITTITQMVEKFRTLLECLVANPDQRLGELPALRRAELQEPTQKKATYVAPQKEIELILAAVWQEVLYLEKVGIHDNFFDLGGIPF
jgi:hypothetical protein